MDLLEMWELMSWPVKTMMGILAVMSMMSVGVFFERIFTFLQAQKQSKTFAPQVAKYLKDHKLKDGIAVSQSKNYKYSHLAKVVLAGLQEYQFQQDTGVQLEKEDVVDSVRRAIQRAAALTAAGPQEGPRHSGHHRVDRRVRRAAGHDARRHQRVPGDRADRVGRPRRRLRRHLGSARRNGHRAVRGDPGGVVLQLPHRAHRVLQRGDGQLFVGAPSTTSSSGRR